MSHESPEVHPLNPTDQKICDDLAAWYESQRWDEAVEPSRILDKKAWDQKIKELGKLEIAKEVGSVVGITRRP